MPRELNRRDFLRSGIVTVGAIALGPSIWRAAIADPAQPGESPYGDLGPADENGIRLPEGFTSREIARSGAPIVGSALAAPYVWHHFPDGGAVFPSDDGGWVYVSNSEVPFGGGVGAVRFDPDGGIHSAYRLLAGTSQNCAGGPTPWGTWLSCEEHPWGFTWEVDPFAPLPEVAVASQEVSGDGARPALGRFQHEAAAVDPVNGRIYLTEDQSDGRLYRFTPDSLAQDPHTEPWDLSTGTLEAAEVVDLQAVLDPAYGTSSVVWHEIRDPQAFEGEATPTRSQVPETTPFDGGEGTWFDQGIVYFTTKGDDRVWEYDTTNDEIGLLYDANGPLNGVDNIFVSGGSGEIFVAEDHQDPEEGLDIVIITPDRRVARLLQVTGTQHEASELVGPILFFDSAGDGHFYFSSQRAYGQGATYEVTGPFNRARRGRRRPRRGSRGRRRPPRAPSPRTPRRR